MVTNSGGATNAANVSGTINLTGGSLSVAGDIVRGTVTGTQANLATVIVNGPTATINLNGNKIGSATGNIALSAQSGTLNALGELNGGGPLTKTSANTLTMTGNNTYTGSTLIQAGTLALSTSSANNIPNSAKILAGDTLAHNTAVLDATAVTASGGFALGSGQTLAGFGTVNAPAAGIVVGTGSTISAGDGATIPGLLTTNGGHSWNAGGAYNIKLNYNNASTSTSSSGQTLDTGGAQGGASWDLLGMSTLSAAGSAGSFNINMVPINGLTTSGAPFSAGNSYQWAIADITQGNAASLLANFHLNAATFAAATSSDPTAYSLGVISDPGSGQDIVINYSPAPEPTSLFMLGLGVGGLMFRRRRAVRG